LRDYRIFATDESPQETAGASVSAERLPNGLYRIDWMRSNSVEDLVDRPGDPHLIASWLTFSKLGKCWQLIEDGLAKATGPLDN
jgi:hypothetical protein